MMQVQCATNCRLAACLLIGKGRHIVLQHTEFVQVVLPHNVGPVGQHLHGRGQGKRGMASKEQQQGRDAGAGGSSEHALLASRNDKLPACTAGESA